MRYQIQWNHSGSWRPLDSDLFDDAALPFDDPKNAIGAIYNFDTYGGKASYRVIDDAGVIYYQKSEMYETVFNIYEPDLLREMQQSLGVDDNVWSKAIQYWLDHYKAKDK